MEERAKCDTVIQKIVQGAEVGDSEIQFRFDEGGKKLYHLIVRSSDKKIFDIYGIEITSVFAPYYVVWASREQIQMLIQSPYVERLQRGALHNVQEYTR